MTLTGYGYNPFGGGYGQPAPQMYAQQAYAQQMMAQPVPQQMQPRVSVQMVTNRDEATTAQIPFDTNIINVFVNMSAGEIYMKRFNPNTGGALFDEFIHAQKAQQMAQKQQEEPAPQYATVEMVQALDSRVSELADAITAKRARGAKTDE
jgi:hypothetical protein